MDDAWLRARHGAGTQVLTHLPWTLFIGELDQSSRAICMGAGWAINAVVAEWVIRRNAARRTPRAVPVALGVVR